MAISVVCGGCQSEYSVPESAAGKRAKCKKCGQVMLVPQPALDEPELIPIEDGPVLTPIEDEPQLMPLAAPQDDLSAALSDIASLPSKLNTTYVAPTPPGSPTGTTVFLSILSGIITFLVSVASGVLLLCTLSPYLSLTILLFGLTASAGSVMLGMKQRLGLAWTVCGIYCCVSCLAVAKAGYDVASGVTRAAEQAAASEKAREAAEINHGAGVVPATPTTPTTTPTDKPSQPSEEKSEPVKTTLVTNSDLSNDPPPWKPAVYRPKLADWELVADPVPEWATVGEGKPLTITFESSPISPVCFPTAPGRMIGVNARVNRQPVLQVWDLHLRKQVGQLAGQNAFVQNEYIISPDGQNIAGIVDASASPQPNGNGQPAAGGSGIQFEIWSLATAQRTQQISLPAGQKTYHFEFLSNERVVVCYHEATRFHFTVYDITTGREVCAGSADDDEGNIHKVVLSPGRRYLWNPQRDSLTVWDLINGRIVGTVTPPKSCDLTGMALAPNGKELLMGLERRGVSYVLVMDLLTKAVKQQLAPTFAGRPNPFRSNFGRPISCQWTADGQQWFAGQQLIQQTTGEVVDGLPSATAGAPKAAALLDNDQLLTLIEEQGLWVVELKPLQAQLLAMKDRRPGARRTPTAEQSPTDVAGRVRPRPGDTTTGDLYATLLASDPDTWKQQWQWCETLNRPIVGLRWGIGVQMPVSPAQAQAVLQPRAATHASLHWLTSESGPVGAELVDLLKAKTADGKFGEFAGLKESPLTDVMILGGGDRTQVMASARRAGVDLALVICLQSVTRGKTKDMSMTIQVHDLASAKKVWESSSLLSSKVAEATARGDEPFANIVAETTKFIDEQLLLAPLNKMPRPTIIARADAAQLHRTNPLASLAELRLYDHHRAISKESMLEASNKLLGDAADAAKLAGDDAAARDAVIKKYQAQWKIK